MFCASDGGKKTARTDSGRKRRLDVNTIGVVDSAHLKAVVTSCRKRGGKEERERENKRRVSQSRTTSEKREWGRKEGWGRKMKEEEGEGRR